MWNNNSNGNEALDRLMTACEGFTKSKNRLETAIRSVADSQIELTSALNEAESSTKSLGSSIVELPMAEKDELIGVINTWMAALASMRTHLTTATDAMVDAAIPIMLAEAKERGE